MELSDYLRILRAHWVGVAALALAGLLGAAVFSLTQPKVYAANAEGFVATGLGGNPALASVGDSLAKSRAQSYVDLATSRGTAAQVIADLHLSVSPASLIGSISVDQPPDTVLINITARASSPQQAQRLADAWVGALAEQVASIEDPSGKHPKQSMHIVPVESAALPTSPVSPRTNMNLALGLVLGLLLGFGYAVVRNQLDRRIRSAAAVEKQFGVTVMGAVPESAVLAHAPGERAPLAVNETLTGQAAPVAEAFRKLRTNLAFMDIDDPPKIIVVTSPHQADGKSTVAANVAAAIALSGQKVVLVDGDLRRPAVASALGLEDAVGLTDVLIGRVQVSEVVQEHPSYPSLWVLAAGRVPPNPSELLGSKTMATLLRRLAKGATVIIDAPPLLPVTDAAVLTTVADGALVVVSAGRTLDTELGDALASLEAVHGRALGVILNRVPRRGSATGYYGDYYQSRSAAAEEPAVAAAPSVDVVAAEGEPEPADA